MATMSTDLPFLFQPIRIVETSQVEGADAEAFHFDLLSFLSIAKKFNVDFVSITWQPALQSLGQGASSQISQAQIDTPMYLAFKRLGDIATQPSVSTEQVEEAQFRTLISELVTLETLKEHPNVIDLLGVTWESDAQSHQVLPVLLTERSRLGNLTDFLGSAEGRGLSPAAKVQICCDVARACDEMHRYGIVHGDIKPENVLVFETELQWSSDKVLNATDARRPKYTAKVIDFGYSCLGGSEIDLVRVSRTRPWQAPEHRIDEFVSFSEARKMDVYSFGMLICRVFLPNLLSLLQDQCTTHGQWLDEIDLLKNQPTFIDNISTRLMALPDLPADIKFRTSVALRQLLQHDPLVRTYDFSQIIAILTGNSDVEPINIPESPNFQRMAHRIISDLLAVLDDEDYLLKRQIYLDLRKRIEGPKCECFPSAAQNLGLAYEIGFGIPRNLVKANCHLRQGGIELESRHEALKSISETYEPKEPRRLQEKLGYDVALPFDPIQLYRLQSRLKPALRILEREANDRRESFGELSRPYLALMLNLTLLLINERQLDKAAKIGAKTVASCEKMYGLHDDQTINAYDYLAFVLFQSGRWDEVEKLQLELIPRKEQIPHYGPTNATTLNSRNYLVAIYCLQSRYDECIKAASHLVALRNQILGNTHPETITTETWLLRATLESGNLSNLEDRVQDLMRRSEETHGADDISTLQIKELLAATILANATHLGSESMHEEGLSRALQLATDIVSTIDNSHDEDDSSIDTEHTSMTVGHDISPVSQDDNSNVLETSKALNEFETLILLRSATTMICALALSGDLDNAMAEIDFVRTKIQFQGLRIDQELAKFAEVTELVLKLQGSGVHTKVDVPTVRMRLAHRWSNVG